MSGKDENLLTLLYLDKFVHAAGEQLAAHWTGLGQSSQ